MAEAEEKMKKIRYYTERNSFGVEAAVILFALSIIFRVIGCWGLWKDQLYLLSQIALPTVSALLFILLLVFLGRIALWTTSLPMMMGTAFFILRAMTFDSTVKIVLCVVLYVLLAVLYIGTVFNVIPGRWPLMLAFALPLVYHIVMIDLPALNDLEHPVSFAAGMREMSILCIILAMFFTAVAIKKRVIEPELPKIKDPKVVVPEKPAAAPTEAPAAPTETPAAPAQTPAAPVEAPAAPPAEMPAEEPQPEASPEETGGEAL